MSENTPTYNQSGWKLTDLFTSFSDPAINQTYQDLEARVEKFVSQREELKTEISSEKFLQMVRELEEMNKIAYRLYGFASLSFSANTQDQTAQINIARFQQFEAEMENRTMFFSLWWKALDDENAARLLDASGDYRYWLEQMRNFKPYTLSEPEEKVINIKNVTGRSAHDMLYDSITNR